MHLLKTGRYQKLFKTVEVHRKILYYTSHPRKLTSFMIMVPSMANIKSLKVTLTNWITFCILSISCLKNMFNGFMIPITRNLINESTCIHRTTQQKEYTTYPLLQMDRNLVALWLTCLSIAALLILLCFRLLHHQTLLAELIVLCTTYWSSYLFDTLEKFSHSYYLYRVLLFVYMDISVRGRTL